MLYCEIVQLFITIDKINCVPMDCWRWNILNFNHQWCVAMRFRFVPKKHAKKRRRRKKINSINICLYKAIYSTGQMASNFFLKIPSNFSFKSFRVIVKQPRVCSRFHFLRFRGRRASHILAQNRGHLCSEPAKSLCDVERNVIENVKKLTFLSEPFVYYVPKQHPNHENWSIESNTTTGSGKKLWA